MLLLVFFFKREGISNSFFFELCHGPHVILSTPHYFELVSDVRRRKCLTFSLTYLFFSWINRFMIIVEKWNRVRFQFCEHFFFVNIVRKINSCFFQIFCIISIFHVIFANKYLPQSFIHCLRFFFYVTMTIFDVFRNSISFFLSSNSFIHSTWFSFKCRLSLLIIS